MLFSFFDNVIRSSTLLFTVVSTDNFEPALKVFSCVGTRAKKNSKQRLPPERKRDMIRWLTYLKHFVKILSNRYQDFNQYQSSICFRQNPTLAMLEIVSWKVGGCYLTRNNFLSREKNIYSKQQFCEWLDVFNCTKKADLRKSRVEMCRGLSGACRKTTLLVAIFL